MYENIDILWVLVCAFLVFLMQFGFSLIETGTVRSKNTINVAMKNLIDTTFGVMFFWLIGFGLMFGVDQWGLFGISDFAILGDNLEQNAFFFFQAMFAATAITIVSGAVAERIQFNGYIVVAIIVTSLIYPLFGHWAWNEYGWLAKLGFTDFAGSTVVHSIGAWIGLAGAVVIGPRLGKFRKGRIKYFSPSNHSFIVFGVFILFFGWFGFNAGSLLKFDLEVTKILINTLISASFGGFAGWVLSLVYKEKLAVELFSFGIIAGLVGITAGCNQFSTFVSALIGFNSTIIMFYTDQWLLKKLKVDDPLSVVSIHGFVGAWGTLCVGMFAAIPAGLTRFEFIGVQALGIVTAFVFAFILGVIVFLILFKMKLLRVQKRSEVLGLNVSEHNAKLPWVETVDSIIKIMKTGNLNAKVYEERETEVGIVARFFNYLLDVLREKQVKLKTKAEIDPLTNIFNRRAVLEKIENRNMYNNNLSVMIIDIDKFKSINDNYGHDVGDTVLVELCDLIKNSIREHDMLARWGGEEFVLISNTNSLANLEKIAEKLRKEIESFSFSTVKNVTASFGISFPKCEKETFEEVFKQADSALYQAKELGRNRVCSW